MKVWYQVWLPPTEGRPEPKVFGMRANDGVIDRAGAGYTALIGQRYDSISALYRTRGAYVSEISEEK